MSRVIEDEELSQRDLEQAVGGVTITKLTDAASPSLTLSDPSPTPAPPSSIDVFKFVSAFSS